METVEFAYEVSAKMSEDIEDFILTYLEGSDIVSQYRLSKEELKHALWLLAEENAGRLTHFVEPLTDTEKRIFLYAMSKEKKSCDEIDGLYDTKVRLKRVCEEIERKVKASLWDAKEGNE